MGQRPLTLREREILEGLGCLPVEAVPFAVGNRNLIGSLVEAWAEWRRIAPRNRRNRAARIESWLRAAADEQAVFALATERRPGDIARECLEHRLCFWPNGIPAGPRCGVVSSRLPRDLMARQPAFNAIRAIVTGATDEHTVFVTADGAAASDGAVRCCELFKRPVLQIFADPPAGARTSWLDYLVEQWRPGHAAVGKWPVFVSAPPTDPTSQNPIPARDALLAAFSDQLIVVSLRRTGHWHRHLGRLLEDDYWRFGNIRLTVGEGCCPAEVAAELQSVGAVPWYLDSDSAAKVLIESQQGEAADRRSDTGLLDALQSESVSDWLIHWTRRSDSAWPGETQSHVLDSLLLALPEADHSALASLIRIVSELRLRATGTGQRDARTSVSFSAVPLPDLLDERVFRPHRQRWDFEHTGIAIRRDLLERAGARPVIYGDESTWNELPAGERLWFQKRYSELSTGTIDWADEREWRFPGDVDLSGIGPDDAFLFCPDDAARSVLESVSRWPVVTVAEIARSLKS